MDELTLARADGSYGTLMSRFARADVLVLDDWGLNVLKDGQRQDVLEILEDRDAARSTIITSQLPRAEWHVALGPRWTPKTGAVSRDRRNIVCKYVGGVEHVGVDQRGRLGDVAGN